MDLFHAQHQSLHHIVDRRLGSMEIQLGVVGVRVHTQPAQAVPLSNGSDVSAVDEEKDGP